MMGGRVGRYVYSFTLYTWNPAEVPTYSYNSAVIFVLGVIVEGTQSGSGWWTSGNSDGQQCGAGLRLWGWSQTVPFAQPLTSWWESQNRNGVVHKMVNSHSLMAFQTGRQELRVLLMLQKSGFCSPVEAQVVWHPMIFLPGFSTIQTVVVNGFGISSTLQAWSDTPHVTRQELAAFIVAQAIQTHVGSRNGGVPLLRVCYMPPP